MKSCESSRRVSPINGTNLSSYRDLSEGCHQTIMNEYMGTKAAGFNNWYKFVSGIIALERMVVELEYE